MFKNIEDKRKYQREWVKNNRDTWIAENGPCKCGSFLDLEIDHIDPTEKISHKIWSWKESRRKEELRKCQVLCKKCHKQKTIKYIEDNRKHGTSTMYSNFKCRCDLCKEYKRVIARNYKKKHSPVV